MAQKSKIEWTDRTWNPVTGCTKLSVGCAHCYAETMANRLKAMGVGKYKNGFTPTMHDSVLDEPLKWKKPHTVFVCSMADLFHDAVPFSFIDKIMNTIRQSPYHRYQILTKRAERMVEYFSSSDIPHNVWLGVTVESSSEKTRIDSLRTLQAAIRFISCEPLVEDLGEIDLTNIDWVIVGGESGVSARPMKPEWVRSILQQADEQEVAFFFKQWGTWGSDGIKRNKKANGKALDGKIIQMMPQLAMR
ncbi:MAG: phage Gp37/Gp68 family protein [Oscillospiraceae bacterium]|nr:phage Gp37/Gp68 family protein [Oscillospiraceae bacterium]